MTAETRTRTTPTRSPAASRPPAVSFADALQAMIPACGSTLLPRTGGRPRRRPLPRHHPLTHDTVFAPTFDVATAVPDYVAWRAENPR